MVGIPTPTDSTESSGVHEVADWARARRLEPDAAVAAWAEAQARAIGTTLGGRGLRLFDRRPTGEPCPVTTGAPSDLGHLYETLLSGEVRKRGGVHLTPADVADHLVGLLAPRWAKAGARVLDPAVGGGAFLIAAADALVVAGVPASEATEGLAGVDRDPVAVEVAETALALWSVGQGLEPGPLRTLEVGDGLLAELPECDIALGNPPFLNQLRRHSANAGARRDSLRARWGDLVTAYTDEAWLFLAAALDAVAADGQLVMVQPVSVLAARHGEAVRHRLGDQAQLDGLWISDGRVFEASVEVCAPLLHRTNGEGAARQGRSVRRWRGRNFDELEPGPVAPPAEDWGRVAAAITGIPDIRIHDRTAPGVNGQPEAHGQPRAQSTAETIGDVATVTAGFRDQFYGLAPYVSESTGLDGQADVRPLATVGMLDPFRFRWGSDEFRFAGGRYVSPVLDAAALASADPELGRWVEARNRPKVLIATQTKVIEAWADRSGTVVPATPTISLEPHEPADEDDLWRLLALVMAPAVSADLAATYFGTALSLRALKVSARDLASMPLPRDGASWDEGAGLARSIQETIEVGGPADVELLRTFSDVMQRSFGAGSSGLGDWWIAGWPRR